jgi:hypothetical protein
MAAHDPVERVLSIRGMRTQRNATAPTQRSPFSNFGGLEIIGRANCSAIKAQNKAPDCVAGPLSGPFSFTPPVKKTPPGEGGAEKREKKVVQRQTRTPAR